MLPLAWCTAAAVCRNGVQIFPSRLGFPGMQSNSLGISFWAILYRPALIPKLSLMCHYIFSGAPGCTTMLQTLISAKVNLTSAAPCADRDTCKLWAYYLPFVHSGPVAALVTEAQIKYKRWSRRKREVDIAPHFYIKVLCIEAFLSDVPASANGSTEPRDAASTT